jgi:hypothetical protein
VACRGADDGKVIWSSMCADWIVHDFTNMDGTGIGQLFYDFTLVGNQLR